MRIDLRRKGKVEVKMRKVEWIRKLDIFIMVVEEKKIGKVERKLRKKMLIGERVGFKDIGVGGVKDKIEKIDKREKIEKIKEIEKVKIVREDRKIKKWRICNKDGIERLREKKKLRIREERKMEKGFNVSKVLKKKREGLEGESNKVIELGNLKRMNRKKERVGGRIER